MIQIAVDAMGGDFGLAVTLPAALEYLKQYADVQLLLVGQESELQLRLQGVSAALLRRLTIVPSSQVVTMADKPSVAARQKKDSSMRIGIDLVKQHRADAFVSAGNTGALVAISRFVLKTLPHIDRPSIISVIPRARGHFHMLDLGGSVGGSSDYLFQCALMGSVVCQVLDAIQKPTIGLLNIGEEEIKGNEAIKQAHQLLSQSSLNYIGYIEGDRMFQGGVDVVVCDGLLGNIALKSSEGVARLMSQVIREEIQMNWYRRSVAALAWPVWRGLKKRMDPALHNGATLVGLNGLVIKSHGSAHVFSFQQAIRVAHKEVQQNLLDKMRSGLSGLVAELTRS